MKWISVKDDLPRKHEKVLITDGNTVCLHYKQSAWNFEGDEGNDLFPLTEELKDSDGKWVSCCHIEVGEVTHWMPFTELLSYIQPERSKREDSGHKYCYRLVDGSFTTAEEMDRGYLFSKDETISWVAHGFNRAYHELLVCKVFTEMRCSEHCGNTVKEVQ